MFRFEELEVWKKAIALSDKLFDIAQSVEKHRHFRFAEQMSGAAMSITNNVAEGSASQHKKEFAQFLNIARRPAFECANILIIFKRRNFINSTELIQLKSELLGVCKMLSGLRKSLIS